MNRPKRIARFRGGWEIVRDEVHGITLMHIISRRSLVHKSCWNYVNLEKLYGFENCESSYCPKCYKRIPKKVLFVWRSLTSNLSG